MSLASQCWIFFALLGVVLVWSGSSKKEAGK